MHSLLAFLSAAHKTVSVMSQSAGTQDSSLRITENAQEQLRAAIAEHGGVEVFFVGHVNSEKMVDEVQACAFGNQDAVPVIERAAEPGMVIIHNHPGGDLTPSPADINVSSLMGNKSVGSYIIDNQAQSVRVIVPPIAVAERMALDIRRIEALLHKDGPLARAMTQFEIRPQQSEMLRIVSDSFNNDGLAIIEAATGVGKSLAYLLPAVHWAVGNGEKVVISTNTINLQEQLIGKDIPFLQRNLGLEFKAEIMKGQSNYLCLRKSDYLRTHPDFFDDERMQSEISELLKWSQSTQSGARDDLSFVPDQETWERVGMDGDDCTGRNCSQYSSCFYFKMKQKVSSADLIVANHHLVMADLAVREETGNFGGSAVLPAYQRVIFDEAHHVEDIATHYFGIRITRRDLSRMLNRLVHRERSNTGLLPFLMNQVAVASYKGSVSEYEPLRRLVQEELIPLRHSVADALRQLMDVCAQGVPHLLGEKLKPREEMRMRITPIIEESAFWNETLRLAINRVTDQLVALSRGLNQLNGRLEKLPADIQKEMQDPMATCRALANKLNNRATAFRNFYTLGEGQCRWIEVYRRKEKSEAVVRLNSLPLQIQDKLNHVVFGKAKTVVMTSATLTVDKDFRYFQDQIGLNQEYAVSDMLERLETLLLDTPFDYKKQVMVGVPRDFPPPNSPDFNQMACDFLLHALEASNGSAFLLFTSYRQLNDFYDRLEPQLRKMSFNCLKQGTENRSVLLEQFKKDRTSILFATASFWEGVDVPGDALRMLVLVKLPFRVPTDPLVEARTEMLEALGHDAFREYSLPQAVIRFKQGFGRLIRNRTDYGAVLILDNRVINKFYGKVFLNSLPPADLCCEKAVDLIPKLKSFFKER